MIMTQEESVIVNNAAITYSLWHARNQAIFEGISVPAIQIIQRAANNTSAYFQANSKAQDTTLPKGSSGSNQQLQSNSNHSKANSKWTKPKKHFVKINTDANLQVVGRWGMSCIARDDEGLVKSFSFL